MLPAPHTPQWFLHMADSYSALADAARSNIAAAGHIEVCSICGDKPEGDFRFSAGRLVLRLCPGCKEVCDESYGAAQPSK